MTNKTKHTPGPWRTSRLGNVIAPKYGKIAEIYVSPQDTMPGLTSLNAKANARLIAAAPDLLEALEKISNTPTIGDVRHCQKHKAHDDFIMIARTAIAKARRQS